MTQPASSGRRDAVGQGPPGRSCLVVAIACVLALCSCREVRIAHDPLGQELVIAIDYTWIYPAFVADKPGLRGKSTANGGLIALGPSPHYSFMVHDEQGNELVCYELGQWSVRTRIPLRTRARRVALSIRMQQRVALLNPIETVESTPIVVDLPDTPGGVLHARYFTVTQGRRIESREHCEVRSEAGAAVPTVP